MSPTDDDRRNRRIYETVAELTRAAAGRDAHEQRAMFAEATVAVERLQAAADAAEAEALEKIERALDLFVAAHRAIIDRATGYQCPRCGRVSYNPQDRAHRYCGACHAFEDPTRP